jgi:hypothetical protein
MSAAGSKIVLATFVLAVSASSAFAEDAMKVDTRGSVRDRARPAYDAVGIRAGAFMIYPQASVAETYDDNIYATETNTKDDFITELSSAVNVYSNWSRHALNMTAGVSQLIYEDHTGENRLDWNVGVDGRIDVTRDTQISGALTYAQLHEDRGDPSAPTSASEPTPYTLLTGTTAFKQRFNRMTAELSGDVNVYDYDDILSTTNVVIDQDFRDRTQYDEILKLGYDVSPDTNVYMQGQLNQRTYDKAAVPPAVIRDSDGYAVVVGSDFRLSNLAQGGFYVGYQEQSYDDPTLSKIGGMSYGANMAWFLTPLTTVTFNADAMIEETTTSGASGYYAQSVGVRIDHELLRNVLLNGRVSYENDDYEGVSQTDDTVRAGLGVDYLLNRNFSLGLGYDYTDRSSNVTGEDFTRNKVSLTLTGKL